MRGSLSEVRLMESDLTSKSGLVKSETMSAYYFWSTRKGVDQRE